MSAESENINLLLDHLFRHESGKLVSVLTRIFGTENLDLAEDVVQDSIIEAFKQWTFTGIPENPAGWLYTVSKNKAVNILNREKHKRKYAEEFARYSETETATEQTLDHYFSEQHISDDQLRMIFVCCHPSIPPDSQVALTLKTLCGFSIREIAKAFMTNEETINKKLVRARQKLRQKKINFEVPESNNLEKRIDTVLKTIYLLFNEGYSASTGKDLIRVELCEEAIRLANMISEHDAIHDRSEVYALLSLMQLNTSRFSARQNDEGNILSMAEQDRSVWNKELIQAGLNNLERTIYNNNSVSVYHILAAISACHCTALSFETTDWKSILSLYDSLLQFDNSPVVLLNRAVALSKVYGAEKGIRELELIKVTPSIRTYHLFYSTQAQFYIELNNYSKAADCLEKAIQLSTIPSEKILLKERLKTCAGKIVA
ncbi:MAG: sigma-70 family RNA polymerase sigma factor [Ignavibacteria bacterium]